jgi:hypothetical protein
LRELGRLKREIESWSGRVTERRGNSRLQQLGSQNSPYSALLANFRTLAILGLIWCTEKLVFFVKRPFLWTLNNF